MQYALSELTSTLFTKAWPPKKKDPSRRVNIVDTSDDKTPPMNKYSRRLATAAAPEKQIKIATDPRNATNTILRKHQINYILIKGQFGPTLQKIGSRMNNTLAC